MTEAATQLQTLGGRNYFLVRRLHSLLGLVPVGVFLVMHLSVNASINFGGGEFQKNVDRIHALGPLLVPVEIVGIFLPLLFHAILGVKIWLSGQPNAMAYRYGGNIRYTLQRITGGVAFVFILYHVWHMHWVGQPLAGAFFDPHDAALTAGEAIRQTVFGIPASLFYAIGVLASVYHLANGIWTALITWGVTIGPRSQRTAGYVCAVFGVLLAVAGLSAVRGFREYRGEPPTAGRPASAVDHRPPAGQGT